MSSEIKIWILLLLAVGWFSSNAQVNSANKQLYLFTDREYCISGDTLWFKVLISENGIDRSDVVRVQLDSKNGNLIAGVAKKSKNRWAEGFIHVPDSLSTGVYFVSTFLNSQRSLPQFEVPGKTLFVYNRFEESVTEMAVPEMPESGKRNNGNKPVKIATVKSDYTSGEMVQGSVEIKSDEIAHAVISARMIDPLSHRTGGRTNYVGTGAYPEIPHFEEKNGIMVSGYIADQEGILQKNTLVLLSIAGDPPYFDYCITGDKGDFNFYLQNATGTAKVVLQAVSLESNELVIKPVLNHLQRNGDIQLTSKLLTPDQSDFIKVALQGNFINKLFNPARLKANGFFEMPNRYDIPFYGPPTKRIVPAEFIDLPDFREISRELLPGVQYRVKNSEVTFRMIDIIHNTIFDNEPLRLINGIPVFKNSLFSSLKSTDIDYIDIVQTERIFGDVIFKGILAVSLHNKSDLWMSQQPNIFTFNIPCLQPDRKPGYLTFEKLDSSIPDVRQVYLWEILDTGRLNDFSFNLSDYKGKVEIAVEGTTLTGQYFKTSKTIDVK
ncbi:MAG: hypothetical protein ABFS16_12625 [Bacteroidota bacterium]